ncbi:hypothetical protein NDU88_002845 [Pleurodeles waltl]|uniref:Uncharacterized protein n=1 Tax=Pleurodeles waltl TaxID=8319 RepID=A0AAV7UC93_PLEWA|nr:hypothetical protein NDU88_002845 [Pleurodeles waltl]
METEVGTGIPDTGQWSPKDKLEQQMKPKVLRPKRAYRSTVIISAHIHYCTELMRAKETKKQPSDQAWEQTIHKQNYGSKAVWAEAKRVSQESLNRRQRTLLGATETKEQPHDQDWEQA